MARIFIYKQYCTCIHSTTNYGTNWNFDSNPSTTGTRGNTRELILLSTAACQSSHLTAATKLAANPKIINTNLGTADRQIKLLLEKRKRFKRNVRCPEYTARIHTFVDFTFYTIAINYPKPIRVPVDNNGLSDKFVRKMMDRGWRFASFPPHLYATVLQLESISPVSLARMLNDVERSNPGTFSLAGF